MQSHAFFATLSGMILPWLRFEFNHRCASMAHVNPRFTAAGLVFWRELPNSLRFISNAPYLRMGHSQREFGGLTKPHTSAHSPEYHQGPTFLNASSRVSYSCLGLVQRRQLASLKSPARRSMSSCIIGVRNADNRFTSMLRFSATSLWQCSDMIAKLDWPFLGMRLNQAFDNTASQAHPLQ